jgi:hypothetical protein
MIQIIRIIVTFTKIVFLSWEIWHILSIVIAITKFFVHQIMICIIQICDRNEKKQTHIVTVCD